MSKKRKSKRMSKEELSKYDNVKVSLTPEFRELLNGRTLMEFFCTRMFADEVPEQNPSEPDKSKESGN